MFVRHHDAIFPVLVEGYDVVLRKDGSGATKSAGEKNLYAVMLNQKYNTSDEIGVNCWAETVAAASAESAQQEAMKGLSATERGQTTVASTLALDAIQGYAISVKPKPATSATPPTQKPLGRMSASLVVSRSREPMQSEGTTAPKLYAGCFGLTRDGSAGDGGEDEGVLFLTTADQGKELGKAVLEKGKKQWGQRTGFHAHQTKKIEETQAYTTVSEVKGYTITLEKQENAPKTSPCLYAVVVIQKLEGQWAGQDRWIELVAAADEKEAGSEALNAARTTTSGKTAVEICYRLDAVDGYAVVLHEKR